MAKAIKILTKFDYRWPSRAITAFVPIDWILVKDEVAAHAIGKGFAVPGGRRKKAGNAPPTDHRTDDHVDEPHLVDDGGASAGGAVDPPAGKR